MRINQHITILSVALWLPASASANDGDWQDWIQSHPGIIHDDAGSPFIQRLKVKGCFQFQTAHLDGHDASGNGFDESYEEFRRVRLGAEATFLNHLGAECQANLVADGRSTHPGEDLDWGYHGIDVAYLSLDLGTMLESACFDELTLKYGRLKFTCGYESHESSTDLLTIERSAISNRIYGSYRPTGFVIEAVTNEWSYGMTLFSSTVDGTDNKAFNGWQDGGIYGLHLGFKPSGNLTLGADLAYNDADVNAGEDSIMDYEWAGSLHAHYQDHRFGVIGEVICGDNGSKLGHAAARTGMFWGAVVMPYCWLVEDKLQAVAQYQYQGASEAEGVRINLRYGRAEGITGINGGYGDSHHSLYTGFNYHLAGHHAKIQAGIEYQTMNTPVGSLQTMTYLLGFGTFF